MAGRRCAVPVRGLHFDDRKFARRAKKLGLAPAVVVVA